MVLLTVNFICLYFSSLHTKQLNVINPCSTDSEKIEMLMKCPLKQKFQNTVKFEENFNLGIYLNLDCFNNSLSEWIQYSEENSLFSSKYQWLISSTNNSTFDQFLTRMENVSLFSSADISFALIGQSSVTTYQIFNNGQIYGGILNVSLDEIYDYPDGSCRKVFEVSKRTKFEERCDYRDITLNTLTVVGLKFL